MCDFTLSSFILSLRADSIRFVTTSPIVGRGVVVAAPLFFVPFLPPTFRIAVLTVKQKSGNIIWVHSRSPNFIEHSNRPIWTGVSHPRWHTTVELSAVHCYQRPRGETNCRFGVVLSIIPIQVFRKKRTQLQLMLSMTGRALDGRYLRLNSTLYAGWRFTLWM